MSTAALYHAALVERAKTAVGKGRINQPTASVTLDNPLCGDRVTLDIRAASGKIEDIKHQVRGCLLCEAAAATISESCTGKTTDDARSVLPVIRNLMEKGKPASTRWSSLDIFTPVHHSKSRRDCVLLPFTALEQLLDQLG